jgi:tetratricopeptide (TPR) repeat protein
MADTDPKEIPLVGIHQIGFHGAIDEDDIQCRTRQMIARSLNTRRVVAFVGSGVSAAYGHTNWDTYAAELVKFTLDEINKKKFHVQSHHKTALESFRDQNAKTPDKETPATPPSLARSEKTLMILDLCDELFARQSRAAHKTFRAYSAKLIKKSRDAKSRNLDPLLLLIEKLEIRRFLTTNYDLQIETALIKNLNCQIRSNYKPYRQPGDAHDAVKLVARSLIHSPRNIEDLSQFAVAAPGYECGVFHLHGVVAAPSSMVVTERDYQRVYLQKDRDHRAFREALQVAFVGNAILFLGTGMEEADLLRPLRQFVSEAAHGGYERPIFALLPERPDGAEFRHYLYSRYGVKTLYYPVKEGEDGLTKSFCNAIENLAKSWSIWWQGWQKKPLVRKPYFHLVDEVKKNVMVRHLTNVKSLFPVTEDEDEVAKALINDKARSLILMGPPGSGKGTLGQTIATNDKFGHFEKKFFATAHFSNDFLCMIDAAANYFGADTKPDRETSPLTRFEAAFKHGRNLFVMGGLERLLVPCPVARVLKIKDPLKFEYPLPIGKPVTPEVREFFKLVNRHIGIDENNSESRIVLTSSMWPKTLKKNMPTVWLKGVPEEVVQEAFAALGDEDLVTRLYRTLRGHNYALAVVRSAFEVMEEPGSNEERRHWLDRVVDRLSAVDLPGRPAMAIAMAGRRLLDSKRLELTALEGILQRVALCTTPVTPAAVEACYGGTRNLEEVKNSLCYLQDSNLLIKVQYEYEPFFRSTAHTLVRNRVLTRMGHFPSAPAEAHSFETAGWSSEVPDTLSGPGEGHELSIRSIDEMLDRLEDAGRARRQTMAQSTEHDPPGVMKDHEYRHLIRATFGLIRSRWTATAIPRLSVVKPETPLRLPLPHYDAYKRRLARLLNAIRTMYTIRRLWLNEDSSPDEVTDTARTHVEVEHEEGVLYADELAWLYNELGLVAFSTGLVADSYALFRAGQHVNAVAERGFHGHRWCASAINLGLVQVERGNLARGLTHLESALRTAHALGDNLLKARARGHLGLVRHLMGNYQRAEKLYDRAIKVLLRVGNHRGSSIFLMHRADLRRRMHRFKEAASDLRESVAAAESGRHPDLVHYANLANAKLKRTRKSEQVTLEELTPAIDFARRVGIPRLECDAHIVQGQIALEQGEYDMAGRLAVSSLGIASSLGLRLRLTGGLILLGRVSEARGHWGGATKLYRAAIELAERQGNQLLIEKGEEALRASRSAALRRPLF